MYVSKLNFGSFVFFNFFFFFKFLQLVLFVSS